MTNEFWYFLESNFVGVNSLFVLVYTNQNANAKRFETRRYYLSEGIIRSCNVIINGKNFYDQATDSDIKSSKEIKKSTRGQGEDYTTGCSLDYDYISKIIRGSWQLI